MTLNKFKNRTFKQFINSAISPNNVGEITLWGDIYSEVPTDWWTGEPLDIECITTKSFKEEFEKVKDCSEVIIHLNSPGGDATAGIAIHNFLKSSGKKLTCVIDALAASAAFTIASACDEVQVYQGSIMMCHEVKGFMWGLYSNSELQEHMNGNTAYNNSAASMYAQKSGLTKQQCLNLMAKTTWMDAEQAIKYGFADTLLDGDGQKDDEQDNSSSLEVINKDKMRINGIEMDVRNLHIPDEFINKMQKTSNSNELGGKCMTLDETKKNKIVDKILALFSNEADEDDDKNEDGEKDEEKENKKNKKNEAEEEEKEKDKDKDKDKENEGEDDGKEKENAVLAERKRMQDILEISNGIDPKLVSEAMFGKTACSAAELTLRAKKAEQQKADKALNDMKKDSDSSNVNSVKADGAKFGAEQLKESDERENAVKALQAKLSKGGK